MQQHQATPHAAEAQEATEREQVAHLKKRKGLWLEQNIAANDDLANMPEHLTTREAAKALRRTAQTLRKWACYQVGPIRPVRVSGKLLWRRDDIRALLGQS